MLHSLKIIRSRLTRSTRAPTPVFVNFHMDTCHQLISDASDLMPARTSAHVDPPRVKTSSLRRPKRFAFLTVQVPNEDEKHHRPDLPQQVLDVYENLPIGDDWGATGRMVLRRLEHLKYLDHVAYKTAVAQGLRAPFPPKLRA